MAYTAEERETVYSVTDAEEKGHIYTSQRPMITKLLANTSFEKEWEEKENGRVIAIAGFLPKNAIATPRDPLARKPRVVKKRKGLPKAIKKCGFERPDGTICEGIATKATGRCRHHA